MTRFPCFLHHPAIKRLAVWGKQNDWVNWCDVALECGSWDNDQMSNCLFCSIVAGDIPADKVAETDEVLVFRDIDPKAPTHMLAIPKKHYVNVAELAVDDPELAGRLLAVLTEAGVAEGLTGGYRVVFNTGQEGGQTVDHVHGHLLGGRQLTWPPG